MNPLATPLRKTYPHFFVILLLFTITGCSLVRIESEQKPLGVRELNTRLLTQEFAKTAMDRIELAADSILTLSKGDKRIQLNALEWKVQTLEEFGRISFQTEPRMALLDTWAYSLETREALGNPHLERLFGPHKPLAMEAVDQNIDEIDRIARSVLEKKEYERLKGFVEDYAHNTPLLLQQEFKHQSLRDAYLDFSKIPDSIAVQTVGTLSEVVADASNRMGYWTDASAKRFNWKLEMMLKEKGLDSVVIEEKIAEFEAQFNRLLEVAENSPETIGEAIADFRNNISPLFAGLNREIEAAAMSLATDIQTVDLMLKRERVALDSIITRERVALTAKADELVETGIAEAFDGLAKTLRSLILYIILAFLVILGLPFYLGYLLGIRKSKTKAS